MQANIVKLSFLMSYLALLICVVSGIPFVAAVLRSVILLGVFSVLGFLMRWYMLNVVTSVEDKREEDTSAAYVADEPDEDLEPEGLGGPEGGMESVQAENSE